MNLGFANDKIFLLYKKSERAHIEEMKELLAAQGVIPIPCDDPANFRFVTPQVIPNQHLDLIGSLALKHLSSYQSPDFVKDLRAVLCNPDSPEVRV